MAIAKDIDLIAPLSIAAIPARNRRGRFTDRLFFYLFRAGIASALPAIVLFALLAGFQPLHLDAVFGPTLGLPVRIALALLVMIPVTMFFSWLSARRLTGLLANLAQVAVHVGDGDWSQRAAMQGPVEVRTLAYRINATAELMQRLLSAITTGSGQMETAAKQQIEVATQASERTAQLARSASTISEHATQVASLAASTRNDLEQAQFDFDTYIKHSQEEGKRVNQVEDILALINGIANQTNLLSLNASLEAERSGAAGRGLAAIAEEIRLLAEDAKARASEIATVLVEVEAKRVEASADLERASAQLEVSRVSLSEVADASAAVQATTADQALASRQVLTDMNRITYGSQQIAETAQKISAAHLFRHRERRK